MANYPSYKQLLGSGFDIADDVTIDRSVAGDVRGRGWYPARKSVFTLRHVLTTAEWAAMLSFYDTNRLLAVTLAFAGDGANYAVWFNGPPRIVSRPSPALVDAEVRLVQQ